MPPMKPQSLHCCNAQHIGRRSQAWTSAITLSETIAMPVNIPNGRVQSLQWLEGIISQWGDNQALIGLTSAQVISIGTEIANTRQAFSSVETVRADSKAKTGNFYALSDDLSQTAASYISIIKGTAMSSETPAAVYLAAGITPKDPPSPLAPPEQPVIESLTLNSLGDITLTWTGRGPVGTVYIVSRKLNTEPTWTIVGQTGGLDKVLIDSAVPDGTASASYNVTAVRGSDESAASVQSTIDLKGNAAAEGAAEAA